MCVVPPASPTNTQTAKSLPHSTAPLPCARSICETEIHATGTYQVRVQQQAAVRTCPVDVTRTEGERQGGGLQLGR